MSKYYYIMSKRKLKNPYAVFAGATIGDWTVIKLSTYTDLHSLVFWCCQCKCGAKHIVSYHALRSGKSKKCQKCNAYAASMCGKKHGDSRSTEYKSWLQARYRCNNKNYKHYGDRNITFCEEWSGENGYVNFLAYMGRKPAPDCSIDRINVNGNYEPGNCKWSDPKTQARNKRCTVYLTVDDVTHPLTAWAELVGVQIGTIRARLRGGWSHKQAVYGKRAI